MRIAKRLRRVHIILGVIAGLCFGWQALPAAADGGYPYAATPCVWAPHATEGKCADYDWGNIPDNAGAASVISPYGYYYRNCTDYTAWKVSVLGAGPGQFKGLGNAKDWAKLAPGHDLRVDDSPSVGAVAVRTSGLYGHTAFVESVHGDGSILVSQYNNAGDGHYSEQRGTPATLGFSAFVHFEDYEVKPAIAVAPVPAPAVVTTPEPAPEPVTSPTEESPVVSEPSPAESVEPTTDLTSIQTVSEAEPAPVSESKPIVPSPAAPQPIASPLPVPPPTFLPLHSVIQAPFIKPVKYVRPAPTYHYWSFVALGLAVLLFVPLRLIWYDYSRHD